MGESSSLQGAMGGMGEAFTTTLVGLTAAAVVTVIYLPNEIAIEHFRRQLARFNARIEAALAKRDVGSAEPARKEVLHAQH
jgi:biopolymer transport protein ExbB/TolQ